MGRFQLQKKNHDSLNLGQKILVRYRIEAKPPIKWVAIPTHQVNQDNDYLLSHFPGYNVGVKLLNSSRVFSFSSFPREKYRLFFSSLFHCCELYIYTDYSSFIRSFPHLPGNFFWLRTAKEKISIVSLKSKNARKSQFRPDSSSSSGNSFDYSVILFSICILKSASKGKCVFSVQEMPIEFPFFVCFPSQKVNPRKLEGHLKPFA